MLLSGLPLSRKPSFLRQLTLLASVWNHRGRETFLCGPVFPEGTVGVAVPSDPLWRLQNGGQDHRGFGEVVARTAAEAVIALGYPDQFPFLYEKREIGIPSFLWSQFSRVPGQALPEQPVYIPLTGKTESFLRLAGCSRIGPIIPHGVDSRRFTPQPEPLRSRLKRSHGLRECFVVGSIGNNSRRKRFDLVVRSFALFTQARQNARLMIKTDRLVSLDGVDLPALIAREGISDRVEVIAEQRSDQELVELYNLMDLYLNLSEWEGFCIPVIEAMACGVPVVSLPIQGPEEILPYRDTLVPGSLVQEEEGSLLYEADPQAVCRVLLEIAEQGELRRQLSRRGRAEAESSYDIRRIVESWEAVL